MVMNRAGVKYVLLNTNTVQIYFSGFQYKYKYTSNKLMKYKYKYKYSPPNTNTHWGRDKIAAIFADDIFKFILL